MPDYSYVIISPVRNEGRWIAKTIESISQQTILPMEYILVDDDSTDNTTAEIKKILPDHAWIRLIELPAREQMTTAEAVVRAFNRGYSERQTAQPDYIAKLDGDIELPADFFERCFHAFEKDPELGITGGTIRTMHGSTWITERVPSHHVRGATKVYRWACWKDIGGFVPRHGWDGIDILQAQMKGWKSAHIPDLMVDHFRPTGKRQGGLSTRFERGKLYHYLGSHPLFVLFVAARRLFDWPYVSGSAAIIGGYLYAWLKREKQIEDKDLIRFYRQQQLWRMTFGILGK